MPSVRSGGLDIAYDEHGSGDPVVLINGTGETARTWGPFLERLAQRYQCIAIDNRDAGRSSYADRDYAPTDMAGDVVAVLEALGTEACHVVGFSLGGAVAQELALVRSDLVRSLALVATWARSDAWFVSQMRSWQALRRAFPDDEHAFNEALAPWCLGPATMGEPAALARIHGIWDAEVEQRPDGFIRQCEADIAHDAEARLRQVRAPALVLVGEEDICTPPRYARALAAALPAARLETVPGAGHCVVLERPDDATRLIEEHLRTA